MSEINVSALCTCDHEIGYHGTIHGIKYCDVHNCKCKGWTPKPTFPDTVENLRSEVEMWKSNFQKLIGYASHHYNCPLSDNPSSKKPCKCGLDNLLKQD